MILAIQARYTHAYVLAQNNEEASIKEVMDNYFRSITNRDIDLMMQQISPNFSFKVKDEHVDRAKFQSKMEERFRNNIDASISDLKIISVKVENTKATLVEEHNFKGFNVVTAENQSWSRRNEFHLVKENGSWKIVAFSPVNIEGNGLKPAESSP